MTGSREHDACGRTGSIYGEIHFQGRIVRIPPIGRGEGCLHGHVIRGLRAHGETSTRWKKSAIGYPGMKGPCSGRASGGNPDIC
jgi:hypothetical protein